MQQEKQGFSIPGFLSSLGKGKNIVQRQAKQRFYTQGGTAPSLFYIQEGTVRLTVVSKRGKEATVGLLGPGDFFGEGCLAGQAVRAASATCISDCTVIEVDKKVVIRVLRENPAFAEGFLSYVLARNIRYQEDLLDLLFNKSEKRLARLLVVLSRLDKDSKTQPILPRISQETLAEMIGTTRGRVSYFMTKFKRMGLIDYNGGIRVHKALLKFLQAD